MVGPGKVSWMEPPMDADAPGVREDEGHAAEIFAQRFGARRLAAVFDAGIRRKHLKEFPTRPAAQSGSFAPSPHLLQDASRRLVPDR